MDDEHLLNFHLIWNSLEFNYFKINYSRKKIYFFKKKNFWFFKINKCSIVGEKTLKKAFISFCKQTDHKTV